MFYHFRQNNSGGSFDTDSKVAINVIIEANDKDHANELAEVVGLYFNGCGAGKDCTCCGDRWEKVWNEDYASEAPEIYGEPVELHNEWSLESGDVMAYVYYLDRPRDTVYQK